MESLNDFEIQNAKYGVCICMYKSYEPGNKNYSEGFVERARNMIKEVVSKVQYGFGAGKGTRNTIFVTRMISERAIEMQRDLFKCFADYSKTFDCLQHEDLVEELDGIGLDTTDIGLIRISLICTILLKDEFCKN